MIKAEVVFDDEDIHVNGYVISIDYKILASKDGKLVSEKSFKSIEDAVKYCLKN